MIASQLMTSPVIGVSLEASVVQAIRLMTQNRISGLPVLTEDGRLVGMLTEGDLLRRVETRTEGDPAGWLGFLRPGHEAEKFVRTHGRRVEEVMSDRVVSVQERTPAAEIVKLMLHHHVKRLPVLRGDRLVGIVSRADLVRRVGDALAAASTTVNDTGADDATIERAIHAAVEGERWAPRNGVSIAVNEGVVRLDGCLTDLRERDAYGVLAENIAGVKRVENGIVCIDPQMGMVTFDPEQDGRRF